MKEQGIKYFAGYTAFKYKRDYPNLGISTRLLPPSAFEFVNIISRGNLTYPSDSFLSNVIMMNKVFENFHNNAICQDDKIKVCTLIKNELQDKINYLIKLLKLLLKVEHILGCIA